MNIPTGYTALDLVGYTDKGDYAALSSYVQNDLVHYQGDVWRCLIDDTTGVTPAENANWTIFVAKPTGAAEAMIAPIESATAIAAHAVGSQLVYNDTLYEVISAIAIGDTLMVGTNIQAADTITEQMANLDAEGIGYDNTGSGLTATNVQDAVDEVKTDLSDLDDAKVGWSEYSESGAVNHLNNVSTTTTSGGVTCTKNANGTNTLTAPTAPSSGVGFPLLSTDANAYVALPLKNGNTYRLSGCPAGGSWVTGALKYGLILFDSDGNKIAEDYGGGATFTFDSSKTYKCQINIGPQAGNNINLTFEPMISAASYHGGYAPHAMTNRELTEQFLPHAYQTWSTTHSITLDGGGGTIALLILIGAASYSYNAVIPLEIDGTGNIGLKAGDFPSGVSYTTSGKTINLTGAQSFQTVLLYVNRK